MSKEHSESKISLEGLPVLDFTGLLTVEEAMKDWPDIDLEKAIKELDDRLEALF